MIWEGAIIATSLLGSIGSAVLLMKKGKKGIETLRLNLENASGEYAIKEEVYTELAGFALGLVGKDEVSEMKKKVVEADNKLQTERGRVAITKAELASVEQRLCELEELERELENSAFEASQELSQLRGEEDEIRRLNEQLEAELNQSLDKLDSLLSEVSQNRELADALNATRTEMVESQRQLEWYQSEVKEINQKYLTLKKSYDALDIEYAQLYEKQTAG